MKQYFGYIRVSTPKQGRGVSLDEQRAAISAYADRQGLHILNWFVETETAAKQGRTEYTKMIKALERGQVQGVIIHKIDRGARNLKDWANLGELLDRGVEVKFVHESLDMHSRGGRLAADIQAVVAADYVRNLRDEVLKGFYGRLKQGVYPLPAPVGYVDKGAGNPKEIDPMAGPIVRYAFERYAVGDISLQELRQDLAAQGLKTRRGGPLSLNGLAHMLHSPFYIGIIHIDRRNESFQGAHTPLITKKLFDRVQAVMAGKSVRVMMKHSFRYRVMIAHAGCTRRLTGEIAKKRFVYYRCHGPGCRGIAIPERILDDGIKRTALAIACDGEDLKDLRDLVADAGKGSTEDLERERRSIRLKLDNCSTRLVRLTDALLDGAISKEMHSERHESLLSEKRGLHDQLEALECEPHWLRLYREFELKNEQVLRYEMLDDAEKRNLVSDICSNLALDGKNLMIALRSPYKEIAELRSVHYGGPFRGRVRTLGVDFDTMSNNTPVYDSKQRAMKMLEIFKSVADKIMDGILPDLPANDNNPYPSCKSLKSFKSRPAA
jgi:DNA invertase Pin-like site-specific DNA recombinase